MKRVVALSLLALALAMPLKGGKGGKEGPSGYEGPSNGGSEIQAPCRRDEPGCQP